MIINRIGDFGLALAIFAIYTLCHSLDYAVVFGIIANFAESTISFGNLSFNCLDLIGLCLFIGAVGKSAQIGLHT
jgi:NADH:ubiquinone oxidoreductase subunit 5 (subunit L)/multisubunit Na+/H+ antiporter MnhA subunit